MIWNWPVNRDVWNSFMDLHRHRSFHWFEKDLRKTVWAMIALYHMIFYMILKLLQVNQIRFVQFSIVGSIMLDMLFCRSFRYTWKPLLLFEYVFWFESLIWYVSKGWRRAANYLPIPQWSSVSFTSLGLGPTNGFWRRHLPLVALCARNHRLYPICCSM